MHSHGMQAYQRTAVITADPGRLVIMCYEGAILQLKTAKMKYQEKDYEGKGRAIKKTLDIIDELVCALDLEKGGVIARNLESIYNYSTRRILQADVAKDLGGIDEVIALLSELLSAWKEIIEGPARVVEQAKSEPVQVPGKRIMGPMAQYMGA